MKKLHSIGKMLAACVLLARLLALNAHAQAFTAVWNPAGAGINTGFGLWSDGAAWTTGVEPDTNTVVPFAVASAVPCVIDSTAGGAMCYRMNIGDPNPVPNGSTGTLILTNGGTFTAVYDYCAIGYNGTNCLLDVESGCTATFDNHLWVGFLTGATGTLVINGGTVNVMQMTGLGWAGGVGTVHVNSGTLNCAQFNPNQSIGAGSVLDVSAGTVYITGNFVTAINTYASEGRVTAYGGTGTLNVSFNGGLNATVITATSGGSTPPPRQSISSITYSGGQVTITYNTTVGASYHIASTSSLASPASWSAVPGSQTNTVTGTSVSYTFTPGSAPQFYKTSSP